MNGKLKAAIVGCGSIANVHAQVLSHMEDADLCAFADIIPERAEKYAAQYGSAQAGVYAGLTEMLREANPDVIHICTPHNLHAPMACEVLAAGKSAFMEKPPAISRAQFSALQQAEKASAGQLGICFQNRYNESTQVVDRVLKEGRMGRVLGGRAFVTWNRTAEYYESSSWRGDLAQAGGGALINQSIHSLDLLLRWLGTPEQVNASMANLHLNGIVDVEDNVSAYMEFPGGVKGCFYATTAYASDMPIIVEIMCEAGIIRLEGGDVLCRYDSGKTETFHPSASKPLGKSYWGDGHTACIRDFYNCIRNKTAFPQNLASVENTFRVMAQIYESAGWRRF